jgi:hypothetical protein
VSEFALVATYYGREQVKLNEVDEVLKTRGREEKCKQNLTVKPVITAAASTV